MPSMSVPSAMTGVPDPHRATQEVGMPATPVSTVKPCSSRMPVTYRWVSNSWKPSSLKLKMEVDHLLGEVAPSIDIGDHFPLEVVETRVGVQGWASVCGRLLRLRGDDTQGGGDGRESEDPWER